MSRKRRVYSAACKTKLVLEVLQNERSLSEIASAHNITPKNLQNWKKTFLENAELAMEPSKAVKEYKVELSSVQQENEQLTKIVGKMTVEKDWLEKKLKSLGLSERKRLIEPKHSTLSLSQQCHVLGVPRSSYYYREKEAAKQHEIKSRIVEIFEEIPIYGSAKVHQQLLEDGFKVSLNTVASYRQELGLKAVLAVKPVHTTVPIQSHKKYKYLLRGLDISRANQVWSTDITYIKIGGGMVYMAAIIDWHSKAVLAHKLSNSMDCSLVMDVLNQALAHHGKPDILNTDQGSQYTSDIHTKRLKNLGITISMDGKGRATDNICIERFWRSAKCERIYLNEYNNMAELKSDVRDYIEFYNHRRFHETLEYKKPMDVYCDSMLSQKKAKEAA